MKKFLCILLTAFLLTATAFAEAPIGLANPWEESENAELLRDFSFAVPEKAENVIYRKLNDLAEIQLWLDGVNVSFRMMSTADISDISGCYFDWEQESEVEIGSNMGYLISAHDGENIKTVQVCLWYDAVPGISYSVSAIGDNVLMESFDVVSVAEEMYIPMQGESEGFSFEEIAGIPFVMSSGVGGWSTELLIASDGSFTGTFHDSEMGESADEYPCGTVYGCNFHGKFELIEFIDTYEWALKIAELELDEGQVPQTIEDGIRYVTFNDSYGLKLGATMSLYTPGKAVNELCEDAQFWFHLNFNDSPSEVLLCYGLYDAENEYGFLQEDLHADDETDDFSFAGIEDIPFYFSSGVGAWGTTLSVSSDGSFTGSFSDSNLGESEEQYPNGTVYCCDFHGRFDLIGQTAPFEWTLKVAELELDEGQLPEAIEDGIRYITPDEPYGLKLGAEMSLYVPGKPVSELCEDAQFWFHLNLGEVSFDVLPFYAIYDAENEYGFAGEYYDDSTDDNYLFPLEPPYFADSLPNGVPIDAYLFENCFDQKGMLIFDVECPECYNASEILALCHGDTLFAMGSYYVVETVVEKKGEVNINGGHFESDGVTLWPDVNDASILHTVVENDSIFKSYVGTACLPFADEVVFSHYVLNEDGELSEETETHIVPGAEFSSLMLPEWNTLYFFNSESQIILEDEKVAEIVINYRP